MIIDERMVTYINSLDTGHTPFLENLERTAKQDRVPICLLYTSPSPRDTR